MEYVGDEFGTKCASSAQGLDPEFRWEAKFLRLRQVLARCYCSQLELETNEVTSNFACQALITKTLIIILSMQDKRHQPEEKVPLLY